VGVTGCVEADVGELMVSMEAMLLELASGRTLVPRGAPPSPHLRGSTRSMLISTGATGGPRCACDRLNDDW